MNSRLYHALANLIQSTDPAMITSWKALLGPFMGWQIAPQYIGSILPVNSEYIALTRGHYFADKCPAHIDISVADAQLRCQAHLLNGVVHFYVKGYFDQFPIDGQPVMSVICLASDLIIKDNIS